MKTAVIFEGWYFTGTSNWYPWLKEELEKRGYIVSIPELPTIDTDRPDMMKQLAYIESLDVVHQDTAIIGHSLGALLAMRLAEKYTYEKMFLVSGWDFDDLTNEHELFWKTKIDHKWIIKNVKERYCITSDNDPYMTAFTVKEMSERLQATYILVPDAGHFTEKYNIHKIPDILPYF